MSYKARSFKIQGVLNKLLQSFKKSLEDAEEKENDEKETYDTLMDTKKEQLQSAEDALSSSSVEGGARGLSKEQAQEEVNDLKTQISNDEGYIQQAKDDLATKKDEWKARKELMVGEGAAINKAIAILHSDDARDLFKKSHKSQGYSFVQLHSNVDAQFTNAMSMIRLTAKSAGDERLVALSARVALLKGKSDHFADVIKAIDDMIETLKDEQEHELAEKETCEKDRMDDTKDAVDGARAIDEITDEVNRWRAEIAELQAEIEEKEAEIKKIEEELKKATKIREEENAEWERDNEDDTAAAELVGSAKDVLQNFYAENKLNLIQHKPSMFQRKQPAGEAPPPPPSTWEEPYGGAKGESNGIVAILEMIKDDIEKDKTKAKKDEDKAEEEFQTFKTESENQIEVLNDAITDLEDEISGKETKVTEAKEERGTKKDELDTVVEKIHDAEPGCDFIRLNFGMRTKNRDIEIDGLDKAKAILKGAKFEDKE